jgi:RIO kinase 1
MPLPVTNTTDSSAIAPADEDDDDLLDYLDDEDSGGFAPMKPKVRPKRPAVDWTARFEADAPPPESHQDFIVTYQPSRHERGWLLDSLRPFYEQDLITDVLSQVKGGKEASVYCCAAHPSVGVPFVAAKVYRPRQFRNLRNDAMYRAGRPVLTAEGREVKPSDTRIMRALGKKTDFGVAVQHTSWLMYEYNTLAMLRQAGADVPKVYASAENAILMEYIGDEDRAAPTLSEVQLTPEQARPLFGNVLRNIELMLRHDRIHGDLSAYNILYWQARAVLIDFPQVTLRASNPNAEFIFTRDVVRVCEYFARQGVEVGDMEERVAALWSKY